MNKDTFLLAKVFFVHENTERTCSNLMPWQYKHKSVQNLVKFKKNEVELTLSMYYFFLALEDFY